MTMVRLIEMSLSGAVLIALILLIRKTMLHRLSKQGFVLLWGIVLIRLLLPFSVPLKIGGYTMEKSAEFLPEILEPALEGLLPLVQNGTIEQSLISKQIPWIPVIYLIGLLSLAAFAAVSYLVCLQKFHRAIPISNSYLEQWQKSHPLIRKIRFCQCSGVASPLTYGIVRPVILVPEKTDWEDTRQLDYVFLHELYHIRRFDVLLKTAAVVAVCIHWFNPLVWVMVWMFNRDLELSCDEYVIRTNGYDARADYARTLIAMEERNAMPILGYSEFGGNVAEERILSIMKAKPASVVSRCLSIGLTVVLGFGCMISVQAEAPSQPQPIPAPTAATVQATEAPESVTREVPETEASEPETWVWPTQSRTITLPYGVRLSGQEEQYTDHICISATEGAMVYASTDGTISKTGFDLVYGNYVVISESDHVMLFYGHLASVAVSCEDVVQAGDIIGTIGQTGQATGPNLSFAVFVDGKAVDPTVYKEYK